MITATQGKIIVGFTIVALLTISMHARAEDKVGLVAGLPDVKIETGEGGVWQVTINLTKAYVNEEVFIAPVLRDDVSLAEGARYALLGVGKRETSYTFALRVKEGTKSCLFAVTAVKNDKTVALEGLRITRDDKGGITMERTEWSSVAGETIAGYQITIRPALNLWLSQGHCVATWLPKEKISERAIWKVCTAAEKIEQIWTDTSVVSILAIPFALNNQAVVMAEDGRYSEASKLLDEADQIASAFDMETDLRAILWLNQGIFAYWAGEKMQANQIWRRVTMYPKEHVGIAGTLCQLVSTTTLLSIN